MAAKKQGPKISQKVRPAKRNGRTILRLGKVGKIKLADIRKAVLEVRKRSAVAGV